MSDWKKYYMENLYPLQNGVLNCVKNSGAQFYLTGGTALSRGYFNHRYSDDLDLFLENSDDFRSQADTVISGIETADYVIKQSDIIVSPDFISFNVESPDYAGIRLKVDLVNDSAERFGELTETPVYYRTDDWINILSNKLCALLRLEAKDYADLWIISKNRHFNWHRILTDAREKEIGLDPAILADLIKSIPEVQFNSIKWQDAPDWEQFRLEMDRIIYDMLRGDDNSLC